MTTYQVQKHENQILLVEQRNDDIPPVIFDTITEDQNILERTMGETLDEEDFVIEELEIEGYPESFHTVARLVIPEEIRSKLS